MHFLSCLTLSELIGSKNEEKSHILSRQHDYGNIIYKMMKLKSTSIFSQSVPTLQSMENVFDHKKYSTFSSNKLLFLKHFRNILKHLMRAEEI